MGEEGVVVAAAGCTADLNSDLEMGSRCYDRTRYAVLAEGYTSLHIEQTSSGLAEVGCDWLPVGSRVRVSMFS